MINLIKKFENSERVEIKKKLLGHIDRQEKKVVVTANSEIIQYIFQQNDLDLKSHILSSNTVLVSDGNGLKHSLRKMGREVHNYPGVDIVSDLLTYANKTRKKITVLGASEESLNLFINTIKKKYVNIKIVGYMNGYGTKECIDSFMKNQSQLNPDIVLVALGVPRQEKLIYDYLPFFNSGVFIGCGGSIDVIGGYKKRAPNVFIKTKTEWLYRIVKEPERIPRFIESNLFLFQQIKKYRVK